MMEKTMKSCTLTLAFVFALIANAGFAREYDCLMDPSLVVEIGSAEAGIIQSISVQRGNLVTQGQLVAKLESGAEQVALDYARARATDTSPIEIAQGRIDLLATEAERAKELGAKKLVPQAVVDSAVSQYDQAILELRQAEFEKRLAALDETRVAAQLARRNIHAPVDGIVITRMIGPGEYVFAQAPIIQIARIDPLHIEVFLPTDMFTTVQMGQMAKVKPAAPIGGLYEAEVIAIDRVFDAASDTFGVRLKLDNPEGALVAGIDCKIEIGE
ncbi:efflux RND transporter periplasmic adaptor subunit [Sulfitobacter sp. M220]|uniref:efflux RND transporter periplasmic adaptor subunit n=1 Tax=Sulfitobacter sp. M220 TaxID=2675333 RepID=UPI001F02BCE9|nr:efflux RND transporter periplasmic adaptor subunit [Sulfitobacter sp. M220]MCF7779169.1 efflux RND transporter periplasmic adaptor subunit [Sulfitobacter sp. M220]